MRCHIPIDELRALQLPAPAGRGGMIRTSRGATQDASANPSTQGEST